MRAAWLVLAVMLLGCPPTSNPLLCDVDCDAGATGGGAGGGVGGAGGGGGSVADAGCSEDWVCSGWALDAGMASRQCTDVKACGTVASRPALGPAALPALDENYYRCQVQPVLERGCGMLGCHGTETERAFQLYARGRMRHSEQVAQVPTCPPAGTKDLAAEGTGTVMCLGWSRLTPAEWRLNFDGARAFAIGVAVPANNELLTYPLEGNAKAHAGVKPFTLTDPGYLAIKNWLGGTASGPCDAGYN